MYNNWCWRHSNLKFPNRLQYVNIVLEFGAWWSSGLGWHWLHSQKRTSCSKSDIRIRLHRLLMKQLASSLHAVRNLQQVCMQFATCSKSACRLEASCFINLQQDCKYQVAASLMFTDLMQLDEVNRLDTTCDNLHQAGKIHNLHQVCGVSGCVVHVAFHLKKWS